MLTDLPLAELQVFEPDVSLPPDFRQFWDETLSQARETPTRPTWEPVRTPLETLEYYDVTFPGFNGEPIKAWLAGPTGFTQRQNQPLIVEYRGYGGGRGLPGEEPLWPSSGFLHLLMDTRGQGGDWGSGGDTPDPHPVTPHALGLFTNGIESRETYYYRRLITDAIRAVDAALTWPFVDTSRVFCAGMSQGGGLAAITTAWHPGVRAGLADVAFLGNLLRGAMLTDTVPYYELARYLRVNPGAVESVRETLAYFDAVNFARRAAAPCYFSVCLQDEYVPPSCTFSIINQWAGAKSVQVYEFAKHQGVGLTHFYKQHAWLQQFLDVSGS